jgi:hypothetical protein
VMLRPPSPNRYSTIEAMSLASANRHSALWPTMRLRPPPKGCASR